MGNEARLTIQITFHAIVRPAWRRALDMKLLGSWTDSDDRAGAKRLQALQNVPLLDVTSETVG
jgi:hypothetical protein